MLSVIIEWENVEKDPYADFWYPYHLNVEEFAGREQEELELAKSWESLLIMLLVLIKPTIERAMN